MDAVEPFALVTLGLHLALLGCALVLGVGRARGGAAGTLAGLLVAMGLLPWAPWIGARLPVDWLNPLREGFTLTHLEVLTGHQAQQGLLASHGWLVWLPGADDLRTLVGLDLVAQLGALALLAPTLVRLSGSRLAAAVLLLAHGLVSPTTQLMATSETSAPLVALYTALGALAVVAPPGESRVLRAAVVLLAGTCAALARHEWALVTVAGLVAVAAPASPRWTALVDRLATRPRVLLGAALVFVLACVTWVPVWLPILPGRPWLAWALLAAQPTNLAWLATPVLLLRDLPAGVVALALVGAGLSLRSPGPTGGLALLVPGLVAAYHGAAHGMSVQDAHPASGGELLRYVAHLLPLVLLGAAAGWRRVGGGPGWAVLCLIPTLPGAVAVVNPVFPEELVGTWGRGVQTDAAREVRALQARRDVAPDCAVVTWGRAWTGPADERWAWAALLPGPRTTTWPGPADADTDTVLAALHVDTPCVVAWQGPDLAAADVPALPRLVQWPAIALQTRAHVPFVHPEHGLRAEGWVETGWRAVPGHPPGPLPPPR